ncbi:hypothetical protein BRADI_2g53546v3 [Brachypodium distachyon]|uniref:Uncharacterized protein n=1 Tax=Brachypodium distachyon TaxID=15368 RepID=A0A0Q3GH21_BRADI|nr:hypothetical protein BRADI_2g53546v3 [Brachypodium distachyon]
MSLEPVPRLSSSSSIATELARLSLDLSGSGSVIRPGTLLDDYERLAIEAQLSRAVLRRSYSEPSPSRTAALQPEEIQAPAARRAENVERGQGQPAPCEPRARRLWLLEALKRVWCWLGLGLGGAWAGHGRNQERAMPVPQPPTPATRVCLLDYLR